MQDSCNCYCDWRTRKTWLSRVTQSTNRFNLKIKNLKLPDWVGNAPPRNRRKEKKIFQFLSEEKFLPHCRRWKVKITRSRKLSPSQKSLRFWTRGKLQSNRFGEEFRDKITQLGTITWTVFFCRVERTLIDTSGELGIVKWKTTLPANRFQVVSIARHRQIDKEGVFFCVEWKKTTRTRQNLGSTPN